VTSTLSLLRQLRDRRGVLADARADLDGQALDVVVDAMEPLIAETVEAIFEGGEVEEPVRESYVKLGQVTRRGRRSMDERRLTARQLRERDWLAWGGDEWPRRAPISFHGIDYGIAPDSLLNPPHIGTRRRIEPGSRPLPHAVSLEGMAPGQVSRFEFTHPIQSVDLERRADGWHLVGMTRGSPVVRRAADQPEWPRREWTVEPAPGHPDP
jgi:hypothetical protein